MMSIIFNGTIRNVVEECGLFIIKLYLRVFFKTPSLIIVISYNCHSDYYFVVF